MGSLPRPYLDKKDSDYPSSTRTTSKYMPWAPRTSPLTLQTSPNRRFRNLLPDISVRRRPRRRCTSLILVIGCCCVWLLFFGSPRRWLQWEGEGGWATTLTLTEEVEPSSLVYQREHLQRIWEWEIASGHYPTRRSIPFEIGLTKPVYNPAVPPNSDSAIPPDNWKHSSFLSPLVTNATPIGLRRVYLDVATHPPLVAYPPRPVPGSVADLDIIMDNCDFSQDKYVRDCLEVLRVGAGLDNGKRFRRDSIDNWRYLFLEDSNSTSEEVSSPPTRGMQRIHQREPAAAEEAVNPLDLLPELQKSPQSTWESQLPLPSILKHRPYSPSAPCDEDNRRIFHMFWAGPFTDKPYLAILSFLYTQNTGLHLESWPADSPVCRPQFWLWINPGPAASVPNPSATRDMFDKLKTSPWASPFLHPRFRDVIVFKMWNTTEQLDGIPEIKEEWRQFQDRLFKSGGRVVTYKKQDTTSTTEATANLTTSTALPTSEDDLSNREGTKSEDSYDRLSVILSDMARFVLCHRFGGIYLDVDTIFLRDWEELWGWKGAFAYRWSRLPKYNTAVLRMHANSALGTFFFRTALKWGLDFHPMTIAKYLEEAYMEGLLLRLPDALFDPAWLNTEDYQRDRPPQPYFEKFSDFFETPRQTSAAPQALGFEGFFRGSFSYHFHNFWWQPFDPSRNWPDLGPRFAEGERAGRLAAQQKQDPLLEKEQTDKRDLDWSAVMKRTFESYLRGEQPNMYGEWIRW